MFTRDLGKYITSQFITESNWLIKQEIMQILSLSSSNHLSITIPHPNFTRLHTSAYKNQRIPPSSTFLGIKLNPLRSSIDPKCLMMKKRITGVGPVCFSGPISVHQLQWVSTISTAVLMLVKGTAIHKSFLVPLLALQAPSSIISWIRGEYGIWCAFMALLVRLFFFIPGELELPFMALLLIIVAPYQVMNLRGKQEGVVLSLVIASYLAFQHFSRAGSLRKAFDQGSVIATLAIIFTVAVPCLLLV